MQNDLDVLEEVDEKAATEDADLSHTNIGAEILSYDRDACKSLILDTINNNMKEQNKFEKVKKDALKAAVKILSLENAENFLEAVLKFKIINVNKLLSKRISKKINQILSGENDQNIINIYRLRYYKKEDGMTLQVEIDEIDLDALFEKIIKAVKESQIREQEKHGKVGLEKSQFILFETLLSMNKEIPAEQKYKLVQMILDWSNENKVIPQIIDALAKADKDIERLKLKVGKITLEH